MAEPDPARFEPAFDRALALELRDARRVLEDMAVRLCLDPLVSERHAESLQEFDRLAQIIGEVAAILHHDGPRDQAVAAVRLEALRDRLQQPCGVRG